MNDLIKIVTFNIPCDYDQDEENSYVYLRDGVYLWDYYPVCVEMSTGIQSFVHCR